MYIILSSLVCEEWYLLKLCCTLLFQIRFTIIKWPCMFGSVKSIWLNILCPSPHPKGNSLCLWFPESVNPLVVNAFLHYANKTMRTAQFM